MSGGLFAIGEEQNTEPEEDGTPQGQDEAAWYDKREELFYGSFLEAIENVGSGGTVILRSDVSLTEGITVSKSMTITSWEADAPCTIKNTANDTDDRKEAGRIFTVTGCNLMLSNIILDGGKDEAAAYHPPDMRNRQSGAWYV